MTVESLSILCGLGHVLNFLRLVFNKLLAEFDLSEE